MVKPIFGRRSVRSCSKFPTPRSRRYDSIEAKLDVRELLARSVFPFQAGAAARSPLCQRPILVSKASSFSVFRALHILLCTSPEFYDFQFLCTIFVFNMNFLFYSKNEKKVNQITEGLGVGRALMSSRSLSDGRTSLKWRPTTKSGARASSPASTGLQSSASLSLRVKTYCGMKQPDLVELRSEYL